MVGLILRPTVLLVAPSFIVNPEAAHDVAFADVQVRITSDPAATLTGPSDPLTLRSAVGALMDTDADADVGVQSGEPAQETEYVAGVVGLTVMLPDELFAGNPGMVELVHDEA